MDREVLEQHVEAMIDDSRLSDVLDAVSAVCSEKADHIRASYSDESFAKEWELMAGLIRAVSAKCSV
jgi:hypothetical protein